MADRGARAPVPVTQCVILLGGLGTRLGEYTRETPKPLLQVGGRPFVDILISEALRRGFSDILLLAGFRSEVVEDYAVRLSQRLPAGARVRVSVEPEPLGTGGALTQALHLLDDRFLLMNGDTWFDFNWLDLVTDVAPGHATIAARRVPEAERYESLAISGGGQKGYGAKDRGPVSAIVARGQAKGDTCLINGGLYCLERAHLEGFPGKFSLEADLLPRLASRGLLEARGYDGFFIDIGIPDTYHAAQESVPAQGRRPALFLDRDGVVNVDHGYVGSIDRFEWTPGAQRLIRRANDSGWYVFVVTNQAGVARGFYGEQDVRSLHGWINSQLRERGAVIDDFRYCPYHPDGVVEGYRGAHSWRKPEPGMVLDLMAYWPVDAARSVLIGDQPSDLAAAQAAGLAARLFTGGDLDDFAADLFRCGVTPKAEDQDE